MIAGWTKRDRMTAHELMAHEFAAVRGWDVYWNPRRGKPHIAAKPPKRPGL